ncbi:MAG: extracellular solute-binding protein, partial [Clostridia bacterium]|nr:extracellular solute-binding protein [Clostridia bacterium]
PLIGSWKLLWSEKYSGNILQFNNPRDAFGTAQFLIGVSANSTDPAEWRAALEKLKEQKSVVQGYVMDEVFNKMKGCSAAAAPYYAGDFFTMYEDNERLAFFYPEEGTNVFVDSWCIPSSCQNFDLALEYVNFMLETEQAVANAEYLCYASPITEVRENEEYIEYMSDIHEDAISILYDFDISKMEYYYDLPDDIRNGMNELWEELKIESTIGTEIYVICAVVIAALLGFAIYRFVVKRVRAAAFKKYSVQ